MPYDDKFSRCAETFRTVADAFRGGVRDEYLQEVQPTSTHRRNELRPAPLNGMPKKGRPPQRKR